MNIPGIAGRSARKAPLIEFFAMSALQGRKVGVALYQAPVATLVRLPALIEHAHASAAECMLVVEEGAPQLPDVLLDTQQLARICSGCIDAMLAHSKTGKLALQEREWLTQVFKDNLPEVSDEELAVVVASVTKPPAGKISSDEVLRRYAYEIAKEAPGLSKLKGAQGLAVLIAQQEAVTGALHRAKHNHTLRTYPKVKVQSAGK